MEYRVKALITFNDAKEKLLREEGDEFSCDKERFEQLISKKAVELLYVIEDAKIVEEKEVVLNEIMDEATIDETINEVVDEVVEEIFEKKRKKSKK